LFKKIFFLNCYCFKNRVVSSWKFFGLSGIESTPDFFGERASKIIPGTTRYSLLNIYLYSLII